MCNKLYKIVEERRKMKNAMLKEYTINGSSEFDDYRGSGEIFARQKTHDLWMG